jgi:tripartite-type tricarboxylate transporter receptor subunit TctC
MRKLLAVALCAAVLGLGTAQAQTYPDGTITMVVSFAAGGPTDTVARLIGEAMSKDLGQQVIVENVAGAGGTLGAANVADAEPDGYRILLHHIGMATTMTLYRNLPYSSIDSFEPIGLVTEVPMTVVGRADFEPATLAELIAYVKANGDAVTYGNAGIGAASHLCGMLFMSTIGVQMTTIPYKGTGPAMTDLLGGQIDTMCDQTTNTTSQIKAGKIKAYGVTSKTRVPALPDLPTLDEGGLPGFEISIWHGLYAPKGTPKEIIDRLSKSLQVALADPKVIEQFAELGTTPVAADRATPEALAAMLKAEIEKWRPIIQAAGVYAD